METKSQEWIEATEARIREAFDLFDKDKSDVVVQEEIGTIMRALGVYPTERQLVRDILPEMQDDEPTGFVRYAKFSKKMLYLLSTKELEPDTADILLQAFRAIDTENRGFITADIMEEMLTTKGTPFRPKELEQFFLVAKDPDTGNIYYEDYIALLTKNLAPPHLMVLMCLPFDSSDRIPDLLPNHVCVLADVSPKAQLNTSWSGTSRCRLTKLATSYQLLAIRSFRR
eukprot:gene8916-18449_t